jgi:hypothetical protein
MLFNKLQSKLWYNMIRTIEDFYMGKIQYSNLVYGLESDLDTGEFNNKSLVDQWYDYWTPLEIIYATKGEDVTISEVDEYLLVMELFLRSIPLDFDFLIDDVEIIE